MSVSIDADRLTTLVTAVLLLLLLLLGTCFLSSWRSPVCTMLKSAPSNSSRHPFLSESCFLVIYYGLY